MASKLIVLELLSLVATAAAQESSTVKVNIPFPADTFENQEMVGRVITTMRDKANLVISLGCPTGDSACGLFPTQKLTWGPSTWVMHMNAPGGAFTMWQDCEFFLSNDTVACTQSAGGPEANFPGQSMEIHSLTEVTVTITGGLDLYAAANPTAPATTIAAGSGAGETLPTSTGAAAATGFSNSFGAGVGLLAGFGLLF